MDLSSLSQREDTAKVELYHPTSGEQLTDDDGNPMWVEVFGQDSEHYRKLDQKITDRNIQRASRSRHGIGGMSAEQLEAQELERIVGAVKSWHIVFGGEVPECTPAKVRDVFDALPWVRDAVAEGIRNRALFLGN